MLRLLLALALAAALVRVPHASSVTLPAELREVVADAGLIVRGRVTAVRAVRLTGAETSTVATVAVERVLKGEGGAFVSVLVPGGDLGRVRTVMVGAPRLAAGDYAVFFLARAADGLWRPVGLSMGVFRIQATATGLPVVRAPVVHNHTASTGRVVRGDVRRTLLPVAEFESLVGVVLTPAPPGPSSRRAVPRVPR